MLAALPSAEAGLIADYSLDGNTADNVTSVSRQQKLDKERDGG